MNVHYIPNEKLQKSSYVIVLTDGINGNILCYSLGTIKRNAYYLRDDKKQEENLINAAEKKGFIIGNKETEKKGEKNKETDNAKIKTLANRQKYNVLPIRSVESIFTQYKGKVEIATQKHKELNEKNIFYWRKTRGDGNCYYRAVGYGYFELIIKKGPEYIQKLIEL